MSVLGGVFMWCGESVCMCVSECVFVGVESIYMYVCVCVCVGMCVWVCMRECVSVLGCVFMWCGESVCMCVSE